MPSQFVIYIIYEILKIFEFFADTDKSIALY